MYTSAFLQAVDHLMLYEVGGFWDANAPGVVDGTNSHACGLTNDPNDSGGETKFGIAKNSHTTVDITDLTWPQAQDIYYNEYWIAGKCDQMPGRIAALHFDSCVNNGIARASKILQQAMGVTQDGLIGPATLAIVAQTDEIAACNAICNARSQFYQTLVTVRPSTAEYLDGWLRRVSEMQTFVTDPSRSFV